jgi:hypothetical protein
LPAALALWTLAASAETYYVAPSGSDTNSGSRSEPFRSIARARDAVRADGRPGNVILRAGIHYLHETLVLSAEDSGTTLAAEEDAKVVLSGGLELSLNWTPSKEGVLKAKTPAGTAFDQLFVNGQRQHMARYPNRDPDSNKPYSGCAADAFSPERAARWADPAGGYIHALHSAHWGGFHYRITGKKENNEVIYEGGWQNNRRMGMHQHDRMVENILEELDAPSEWYHDATTQTLYFFPPEGLDAKSARYEIARLDHLVEIKGTKEMPAREIVLKNIVFRHANRTFMKTMEPLLRSDWTIYRGGAVLIQNAEDCSLLDCEFDQLGGNGVFVNKHNRRIAVKGCYFHGIGASAVCFVGDPDSVRNPLFEYSQTQHYKDTDTQPGPKTDDYPSDCIVEDCLIHTVSVVEKQAAGVQVSMSKRITIRHCSVYDTGRAGINISEGTFGGHLIEFCDVFDTVRETGDHGSFNSWGRDRFWNLQGAPAEKLPDLALLDTEKTVIRNSRWRCDRGWDIDLDDGSSNYEIYNNLMLNGGLKLREGFHRTVYNNIAVNNGLHPHVWYPDSHDRVYNNIWLDAARPIRMPAGKWGIEVDRNLFVREEDREKNLNYLVDVNSIVGDPVFVDPATGDYRVEPQSPALKLGFKNFPMDRFGVRRPALKAIAKTPPLPVPEIPDDIKGGVRAEPPKTAEWMGATIRALEGQEYSAFGVAREDRGIHLVEVPQGSDAAKAGLKKDDLIQSINKHPVRTNADLAVATKHADKPFTVGYVRAPVCGCLLG